MSAILAASSAGSMIYLLFVLAVIVIEIASWWKIFEKAGQPGWGAIIPIYNIYLIIKIAGRPGWWLVLYFIPFVNFIALIIVSIDVAKAFKKGTGFGLGMAFLSFIFAPILGFGDASYNKPATA